jgi:hypothetical protein
MIATSRRSGSVAVISRQYDFSRLQDQTLASAYEALIPVVSRRPERVPRQHDDCQPLRDVHPSPERLAAGA